MAAGNGNLQIVNEGKTKKIVTSVKQITFSGRYARGIGQRVIYITERAVFELLPEGVVLTEIAPGIDLERDVLEQIEFKPNISPGLKQMDEKFFI